MGVQGRELLWELTFEIQKDASCHPEKGERKEEKWPRAEELQPLDWDLVGGKGDGENQKGVRDLTEKSVSRRTKIQVSKI